MGWPDRFWAKVDATGDCWEWTGAKVPGGYGHIKGPDGGFPLAHRVAYELLVGPIPEGLQLDHLCRTRACVNPDHLEPVTARENRRRSPVPTPDPVWAWASGEDHHARKRLVCPNGHPYTAETVVWRLGRRRCRLCAIARSARYQARLRAAA